MIKIEGRICWVGETTQHSETFRSKKFAVETNEQYPQKLLLQVINEKCELSAIKINNHVLCSVNIKGREWTNKDTGEISYFNTIEAWSINELNKTIVSNEINNSNIGKRLEEQRIEEENFDLLDDDLPF